MAKRFATSLDRFAVMSVVLFAVVAAVAALTHGGELRRPPLRLADKTLVAWVYLADTAQRGGSALTLMEGEDFDSLVFGERMPGRWMAGSDFFRRTQSEAEQQANAAEAADANTLVQIATVWSGDRVFCG